MRSVAKSAMLGFLGLLPSCGRDPNPVTAEPPRAETPMGVQGALPSHSSVATPHNNPPAAPAAASADKAVTAPAAKPAEDHGWVREILLNKDAVDAVRETIRQSVVKRMPIEELQKAVKTVCDELATTGKEADKTKADDLKKLFQL